MSESIPIGPGQSVTLIRVIDLQGQPNWIWPDQIVAITPFGSQDTPTSAIYLTGGIHIAMDMSTDEVLETLFDVSRIPDADTLDSNGYPTNLGYGD